MPRVASATLDELAYHVAVANASASSAVRTLYAFPQPAHSHDRDESRLAALGEARLKRLSRGSVCHFFVSYKNGAETHGVFRVLDLHDEPRCTDDPRVPLAHPASLRAECSLLESVTGDEQPWSRAVVSGDSTTAGAAASSSSSSSAASIVSIRSCDVHSIGFNGPCFPIELSHAKRIDDKDVLNLSAAKAEAAWADFCQDANTGDDPLGGKHAKRLCKTYRKGPSKLLDDAGVFGDDRPIFFGMLVNGVHGMWKARLNMSISETKSLNVPGVMKQHWESGVLFDDYVRLTGTTSCATILANDMRVRLFHMGGTWMLESYGSLLAPIMTPTAGWEPDEEAHITNLVADPSSHEQ
eukprot:5173618-Pleurochrysis_carterae.AAC.1